MKRLNRGNTKNGPLNQKLRQLYTLKQQLNDAYGHAIANLRKLGMSDDVVKIDNHPFYMISYSNLVHRKKVDLNAIDCLINLCWRNSYNNVPGYEILPDYKICHICRHKMYKALTTIDVEGFDGALVECYYCKNCGEKVFTKEVVKRLVDEHKEKVKKSMEEKGNG